MTYERRVAFTEAVKLGFRNYFKFSGRSQRAEFWYWMLFTTLTGLVLSAIESVLGLNASMAKTGPVEGLFQLATAIPTLAVGSRRLHDIGRSGWWQLLPFGGLFLMGFMAVVGPGALSIVSGLGALVAFVLVIVWWATDSDRGANRFGESPKYGSHADVFS